MTTPLEEAGWRLQLTMFENGSANLLVQRVADAASVDVELSSIELSQLLGCMMIELRPDQHGSDELGVDMLQMARQVRLDAYDRSDPRAECWRLSLLGVPDGYVVIDADDLVQLLQGMCVSGCIV